MVLHARLLAMADARRLDTALVDEALASRHPSVRSAAALTIGRVKGRARLARLHTLLDDPDTSVAANAAFALGLLPDTSAVPALQAALSRSAGASRAPVAVEAAWSLGEIGGPARGAIEGALESRPGMPEVDVALLLAAAKLRPVPLAGVLPHLRAADERRVAAAAYAIARTRVPAGVRPLLPLAGSPHGSVRVQVARALARSAAGDSLAALARAALALLAHDTSAHVRINAVRSLATYGADGWEPVAGATRDFDPNVRIAAAQALVDVTPPQPSAWATLWEADTGFTYRRSVAEAAMRRGVSLPALTAPDGWSGRREWWYRAAVANLGGAGASVGHARELAEPLVSDQDPRVRTAAWRALAAWIDSAGTEPAAWRRRLLQDALRDPDPIVRSAAIGALARRPRPEEVPQVLDAYRASAGDSATDARLAALRYLAAAWRRDSASLAPGVREAIRRLPPPADPLERAEGRRLALLSSWPDGVGTPRPLAWYESVVRTSLAPSRSGRPPAARIVTERGTITLELYGVDAPVTVHNFVQLARAGYYRGARFHRVVPNFVAQDGDPRGDGEGGPGYAIRDELNRRRYDRGAVGMALSGPDTGGSQYFITHSPQPHLDGHYTVFGHVTAGYDVLDRIVQGDRILEIQVP